MRRFYVLIIFLIFGESASAQNALLELFHGRYIELTGLKTDSLYISGQDPYLGTVTREISFQYPEGQPSTLSNWVETRHESVGQKIYRLSQQTATSANSTNLEIRTLDSLDMKEIRERRTFYGTTPEMPDSILYELWDSTSWEPVQKARMFYNSTQQLTQRTELQAAMGGWLPLFGTTYTYDGNGRLVERSESNWNSTGWEAQNSYVFTYQAGVLGPVSSGRHLEISGQSVPRDSLSIWYDANGQLDSTILFYRNPSLGGWMPVTRVLFTDKEQKKAQQGKEYRLNSQGSWEAINETQFTGGSLEYTDEPAEILLRHYDSAEEIWKDVRRETSEYELLPDGRVHGILRIEMADDSIGWEEVFLAEAWFKLVNDYQIDTLEERSSQFTFSYTCGLVNPYVENQAINFPATSAPGGYELKIFTEEGRLVYSQQYDDSGLGQVSATLTPGFYVVTVSKGGSPLCTQKLVVR